MCNQKHFFVEFTLNFERFQTSAVILINFFSTVRFMWENSIAIDPNSTKKILIIFNWFHSQFSITHTMRCWFWDIIIDSFFGMLMEYVKWAILSSEKKNSRLCKVLINDDSINENFCCSYYYKLHYSHYFIAPKIRILKVFFLHLYWAS